MNRLSFSIIFLLSIFLIPFVDVAPQPTGNDTCKANLVINSNDSLSVVYINGNPVGTGKNVSFKIPAGNYSLAVKGNKFKWDSGLIHDTLIINNCDTSITLSYSTNKSNKIYLNSMPSNAEVFYHDSLLGYTPLYLRDNLSVIDIKKDEYENKEINIDGSAKEIDLSLNYLGKGYQPGFSKTNLFKLLLGSAVVLGATAAYFKLKADDNFDKFNSTNDKKYRDKTNKYDLVSGVAFGALQINFGILIYHFLSD